MKFKTKNSFILISALWLCQIIGYFTVYSTLLSVFVTNKISKQPNFIKSNLIQILLAIKVSNNRSFFLKIGLANLEKIIADMAVICYVALI